MIATSYSSGADYNPTTTEIQKTRWATREDLLEALRTSFHATAELYSDPLNESLGSHTYRHSLYSEDMSSPLAVVTPPSHGKGPAL
jgi:NADH pyrophosphatase NudC (nudix superfamily)